MVSYFFLSDVRVLFFIWCLRKTIKKFKKSLLMCVLLRALIQPLDVTGWNFGFHWIPRCKQQIFCCCCNFLINLTSDVKFKFSPVQYTSNKPKNLYLFGNIPLPFLSIMFIISLWRMLTADKGLIGCYKVENFFNIKNFENSLLFCEKIYLVWYCLLVKTQVWQYFF